MGTSWKGMELMLVDFVQTIGILNAMEVAKVIGCSVWISTDGHG